MQQELKIIVKADGTATVTRQLDGVTQAANKASAAGKKLSLGKEFMGGMVTGALTAAAAYLSVRTAINTANRALSEFTDAFTAMREVQATLTSTGRAAEFTTAQLADMAGELQQLTGIGDEEILRGATIGLLRFDAITKEMFPRVQKLAVDMSKSMGGVENATRTLGISIADPILGMTRLRRAGIMLDQDQQALIKTLIETGKTAEAQGVLLTALEGKYGGLAQAGVTGATLLKTAWGEYLEAMGGSISALDGVKRGLAQFFFDTAQNSGNLSKAQMKHILDVQEQWANTTLKIAIYAKTALTAVGGAFTGIILAHTSAIGVAYAGWQELINGFLTSWIKMSRMIIQYNPFSIIMKANQKLLELTGVKVNLDFIDQKQLGMLDTLQSKIDKLFPKNAANTVNEATKAWKLWGSNIVATGENAANALASGTQSINAYYDAQRKLVESGKNPFTGMDMTEGETAAGFNAQIDAAQKAQTESVRDMQAEMLTAWAAYYGTLDQYSNESIQAQANLYKYQLQQQYGTILSMQQIDEMYNAKLWELRDKQLAHFAENYEAMPEIVEETMSRMAQITQESVDDIQRSGFNLLNDSIYNLISGTKSLKDVWANAWAAMQEIALRAMSEIITKMITTYMWQTIIGMGTSSLFAGSGMVMPSPGVWTQPVPIPTLGTGTGGINSSISGGGMGSVMSELRSLRMAISDNRDQNFNLYMDGVPLRHALNRVEKRLNYLGSGA